MEERVKQIMQDVFNIPISEIKQNSSMENIAEWDSLKHMALMVAIEENFNCIPFTTDEIIQMTSLQNIISVLQNKVTQ